jgi:hypothetical protein
MAGLITYVSLMPKSRHTGPFKYIGGLRKEANDRIHSATSELGLVYRGGFEVICMASDGDGGSKLLVVCMADLSEAAA